MNTVHIGDTKHLVLVSRGHCATGHDKTFLSYGHYFQDQEMLLTFLIYRNKHTELAKMI